MLINLYKRITYIVYLQECPRKCKRPKINANCLCLYIRQIYLIGIAEKALTAIPCVYRSVKSTGSLHITIC